MHWFFDWDGTMTTKDTLSVVASIGYSKNRKQNLPPWRYFSEAYIADYTAHTKHKADGNVTTSLKDILAWQESLVDVERASVERVEKAGIFANVTTADIDNAAKQAMYNQTVVLRPGLGALLNAIYASGGCTTIVSVNWSARFIHSCLVDALGLQSEKEYSAIKVLANNIKPGSCGRLSRLFEDDSRGIWTAHDKERVMRAELTTQPQRHLSIYVGDSPGDLACLLLANVGICIRDVELSIEQRNMQEDLCNLGISCHWIGEYSLRSSRNDGSVKHLWWARDFQEIRNSLLVKAGIARPDASPVARVDPPPIISYKKQNAASE